MKRKISLSMQYWGIHKNFSTRSYVSIWEEKLDTSSNVFFIKARKNCLIKNVMCLNWLQFYWALASHITKRKSMGKKASCLQQSFLISISRIQNNSPALNMKIFQGFSKTKKIHGLSERQRWVAEWDFYVIVQEDQTVLERE